MASPSKADLEMIPDTTLPDHAVKGRGAVTNRPGRYEPGDRPKEDDGWTQVTEPEFEAGPIDTQVHLDTSRTVLSRNNSPDIPFNYSVNMYRGCEHGCIYCYARPSHTFLGHSAGLDFETQLYAKPDAAQLLERELRKPSYKPESIHLGANTDPYQPIEKTYRLTRQILKVMSDFNNPVTITTKSARVVDDIDLLADLARRRLTHVSISVTTLDRELARVMEPRASTPANRLAAIRKLSDAGVPVALSIAPIIPVLTDHEIESIIEAGAKAGAESVNWVVLRLPLEIKDLFTEWLAAHAPNKAKHVFTLLAQIHGGKIYRSEWGKRMKGSGPYAELIRQRVLKAARRFDLNRGNWNFDLTKFRVPEKESPQLKLFD